MPLVGLVAVLQPQDVVGAVVLLLPQPHDEEDEAGFEYDACRCDFETCLLSLADAHPQLVAGAGAAVAAGAAVSAGAGAAGAGLLSWCR